LGTRRYCFGEQLPWRGSGKKEGKRVGGFLTTTRSSVAHGRREKGAEQRRGVALELGGEGGTARVLRGQKAAAAALVGGQGLGVGSIYGAAWGPRRAGPGHGVAAALSRTRLRSESDRGGRRTRRSGPTWQQEREREVREAGQSGRGNGPSRLGHAGEKRKGRGRAEQAGRGGGWTSWAGPRGRKREREKERKKKRLGWAKRGEVGCSLEKREREGEEKKGF
jgi:hypothetical protein